MQVESARHSFGHTMLQSPAFSKFADLSNVSVDGGVEIIKLACLVGKADVIGINEFPARCGWQIIDVQVEESRSVPVQILVAGHSSASSMNC